MAGSKKTASDQRAKTREETCERHSGMTRRIVKLKLDLRTQVERDTLKRLFLEAKWFANHIVAQRRMGAGWSKIDEKDRLALVKTPLGLETRQLRFLSSQMRQGMKERLHSNEDTIYDNIKAGIITHGELHFTGDLPAIPLKQYGNTYSFDDKYKHVYLQGIKAAEGKRTLKSFRFRGGKQLRKLPADAEIANAVLISKPSGYYLNVTAYIPLVREDSPESIEQALADMDVTGLDAGVSNNMTDDGGATWKWSFEESERLKEAQRKNDAFRKWHKKKYGYERNSNKQMKIMHREYERLENRKQDAINQFKHEMLGGGGLVAVQDEQVAQWACDPSFSGTVHHSILGGIMAALKNSARTLVVDRWTRTTGVCPECGWVLGEKLSLDEREWTCPCCHAEHDRDQASAQVSRLLAVLQATGGLPPEYGELLINRLTILLGCGAQTLIRQL